MQPAKNMFESHQENNNKIYCIPKANNKNTNITSMYFWCTIIFNNKAMVALNS